jgi:hypothetical protein
MSNRSQYFPPGRKNIRFYIIQMLVWVGPVAEFDVTAKRWTQSKPKGMKVCQDLRLAGKVINVIQMLVWVSPMVECYVIAKIWTQFQAKGMKVCQDLRLAQVVINAAVFLIHVVFLFSLRRLVEFKRVVTACLTVIPTAMEGQYVVSTALSGILT